MMTMLLMVMIEYGVRQTKHLALPAASTHLKVTDRSKLLQCKTPIAGSCRTGNKWKSTCRDRH